MFYRRCFLQCKKRLQSRQDLKLVMVFDCQGIPLRVRLDSAYLAEVKLAKITLATGRVGCAGEDWLGIAPYRLIADRAHDSNPLLGRLEKRGIELIVPHRSNPGKSTHTEGGRRLRRYRRGWIVQRTNV